MGTLPFCAPAFKVGTCPDCAGNGHVADPWNGDRHTCDRCEGIGRVHELPPDPPPAVVVYEATQGADVIDTGGVLDLFIRRLDADWKLRAEDIAVWLREGDAPPRLVAYLRPGVGKNLIVYV